MTAIKKQRRLFCIIKVTDDVLKRMLISTLCSKEEVPDGDRWWPR